MTAANAVATITRSTYTAAGQPIAIKVSGHPDGDSNGRFHIHTDHLGSVSVLSKYSDGSVRWGSHAYYEPFGRYRLAPSKDITDRAFTGQRENMEWGLYYYNARFYVPALRRFASADTIVPEPSDPQSFNRYSYTLNNPVKYRDPLGHAVDCGFSRSSDCGDTDGAEVVDYYIKEKGYSIDGEDGPSVLDAPIVEAITDLSHAGNANAQGDLMEINSTLRYYGPSSGNRLCSDGRGSTYPCSQAARYQTCNYWQGCYEPVLTREEMAPDAFIFPAASGSAAGILYGVSGAENIVNLRTGERSAFSYVGQGAGVALEADASVYVGIIWNLKSNSDYEGAFSTLTVDAAALTGAQFSLFWTSGTVPFTGDTWGISAGPSTGAGFGFSATQTVYTLFFSW